ncbi:MAG: M1 family metallopeptidase [Anaerolineae bacterium]|nr:M1 family metallopeptidase [Anaerolineae bacterium]
MKFLFFIVLSGLLVELIVLGFVAFRALRNRAEGSSRRQGYAALGCFTVSAVAACLVAALGACCWLPGRVLPSVLDIAAAPSTTPQAGHGPTHTPAPEPLPVISYPGDTEQFAASMIPEERPALERLDDPPRCTLDVSVLWDQATIVGRERLLLTNNEAAPLDEVVFRLFPNAPYYQEGRLEVGAVEVNGYPVQFALDQDDTVLTVTLPAPLPPEIQADLTLDFTVTVPSRPDRFGVYQDVMVLGHWYPKLSVYDDEGWHADPYVPLGDAYYGEASHFTLNLTLPESLTVAATGVETARRVNDGGSFTLTYQSGAVRDVAVVMGPTLETISTTVGQSTITSFYLPGDQAGGQRALDVAAGSVRTYNELFGPYPYADLDVVEGYFLIDGSPGGMEFSGLVLISSEFYASEGPYTMMDMPAMVVSHEIAHQWWYAAIGDDQVDDPWLDEAFAVYSSILYFEAKQGRKGAQVQLLENCTIPYRLVAWAGGDRPIATSLLDFDDALTYSAIVYGKGGLFLHQLRQALGDERFFGLLQNYYAQFKYRVVRPDDFYAAMLDAAGDAAGREAAARLYDDWVLGATGEPISLDDLRGLLELLK